MRPGSAELPPNENGVHKEKKVINELPPYDLNAYLEKHGEGIPPVSIDLFSLFHGTAYDARGIKERLLECDIYIPESNGWTPEILEKYNDISSGKISRSEAKDVNFWMGKEFSDVILDALHNTHKPVLFIDVSKEDWEEVLQRKKELFPKFTSFKTMSENDYESALSEVDINAHAGTWASLEREKIMLSRLGPKVLEAIENNPDLKAKEKLKVLLTLGGGHTSIYHALRKGDKNINRDFSVNPFYMGYFGELMRRYEFNKDVDKEVIKRALLYLIMVTETVDEKLLRITKDMNKIAKFTTMFINTFNLDELDGVFEKWKESKNSDNEDEFVSFMVEKHGLVMPESEEELDELLSTNKSKR